MRGSFSKSHRVGALAAFLVVAGLTAPGSARPSLAKEREVRAQASFDDGSIHGDLYIAESASEGRKGPVSRQVVVRMLREGQSFESGSGYPPIVFTYEPRLQVVHAAGEIATQYSYVDPATGYSHALPSRISFDVTWRATSPPRRLNAQTPQVGTTIAYERQAEASGFMASKYMGTVSQPIVGDQSYPTVVTFMRQIGVNGVPGPSGVCSYDLPFPICV
jgi:hypothetical protein